MAQVCATEAHSSWIHWLASAPLASFLVGIATCAIFALVVGTMNSCSELRLTAPEICVLKGRSEERREIVGPIFSESYKSAARRADAVCLKLFGGECFIRAFKWTETSSGGEFCSIFDMERSSFSLIHSFRKIIISACSFAQSVLLALCLSSPPLDFPQALVESVYTPWATNTACPHPHTLTVCVLYPPQISRGQKKKRFDKHPVMTQDGAMCFWWLLLPGHQSSGEVAFLFLLPRRLVFQLPKADGVCVFSTDESVSWGGFLPLCRHSSENSPVPVR